MSPRQPITSPPPALPSAAKPSSWLRGIAAILLTLLLLVLAFRLTSSETLRQTLNQKRAEVETAMRVKNGEDIPIIPTVGPAFIAVYMLLTFGLAVGASFVAARVGALNIRRAAQGAFMAFIIALALISTFLAANRFNAVVGTADLAVSLAAAWAVTVLCDSRLLGNRGRQAVIAAIVAICAICCVKALLQKFDEFPTTYQEVMKNPDAAMRGQGLDPNDHAQRELFLSRLRSAEVTGYGALSNVFATQMIAAIGLLAGLMIAGLAMRQGVPPTAAPLEPSKRRASQRAGPESAQIPIHILALILVAVFLAASLAALAFTESKGGIIAAVLTLAVIIVGIVLRHHVLHRRTLIIRTAALACVLFFGIVLGWGFTHHGLPTRSLLFRWHYWTGAVPVIQSHPLAGVGLSNFGDYYPRFKLPYSPEDVKDPHSFFVRLAAEGGIPLALAVAVLLFWMLQGAWSVKAATQSSRPRAATLSIIDPALCLAASMVLTWGPLHFFAERATAFAAILTGFVIGIAWLLFAAVIALFDALEPAATRAVILAGVIAALGMLLYDQINMALVTGPVAMLFWMMLALGESTCCPSPEAPDAPSLPTRKSLSTTLMGSSAGVAAALACTLLYGLFAWDPAPYEYAYIQHISSGEHLRTTTNSYISKISEVEALRAFESLNDAIARAPNSIELHVQRITLLREVLHKPVADEIRKVLAMDNSNANLRILLALPDSDLPPAERIAALKEALAFDQQLAADEPKRLRSEMINQINAVLDRLKEAQPKPPS